MKFTCSDCGQEHDVSEISFGAHEPDQWWKLTDEERSNSELTDETCMIDVPGEQSYFIRAVLVLPIRGTDRTFEWGVWCSLSEASFREVAQRWSDPTRVDLGPQFGWLCTQLPFYPETMFLKTHVRQRPPGLRPLVELESTDHPLAVQQRDGVAPEELAALVRKLLHEQP